MSDTRIARRLAAAVEDRHVDMQGSLAVVRDRARTHHARPRLRFALIAAALAMAATAIGFAVWAFTGKGSTRPASTTLSGRIAFVNSAGEILVMRADGSHVGIVLHGFDPAWSPDGSRIAFRAGTPSDNAPTQIGVMNADGAGFLWGAHLGPSPVTAGRPAWSPDGSRIAVATYRGIEITSVDGAKDRLLVQYRGKLACYDLAPTWAPDGSRIAFSVQCDGGSLGLWVINIDGSGLRHFVPPTAATGPLPGEGSPDDYAPQWSPDGSRIAFSRATGGLDRLFVVNADGSNIESLVPGENPTWSPDGRWIAFDRFGQGHGIYVIRSDGTDVHRVGPADASEPSWGRSANDVPSTPSPSVSDTGVPPLDAVTLVDAQEGWAGGQGAIFHTDDGGRTWDRQYAGAADILHLDFVDRRHGWAVTPGRLLVTHDGGRTWTSAGEPRLLLRSVDFLSRRVGWGVTGQAVFSAPSEGPLVKTIDGGQHWRVVSAIPAADSVCFASPSDGWAASRRRVFRTGDGGSTWSVALNAPIRSPHWVAQVGCAQDSAWGLFHDGVGMSQEAYVVYRSLDGGRSWAPVLDHAYFGGSYPQAPRDSEIDSYAGSFDVVDGKAAFFLGDCPACDGERVRIVGTVNGGSSFLRTTVPSLHGGTFFDGIDFLDRSTGWLAATTLNGRGEILRTDDGGRTWRIQLAS